VDWRGDIRGWLREGSIDHSSSRHSGRPSAARLDRLLGRWFLIGAFALFALVSAPAAARADLSLPTGFSEVTVADRLADPTALAYAPDGRMFIAEKAGRLRVVSPAGSLVKAPVIDISGHVATAGDRGLLGIAVDAAFATNRFVYLLYTYDDDQAHPAAEKTARLTRIRVLPDNTVADALTDPETVLLGTTGPAPCPAPANTSDCIASTSDSHSIGTVRADPDGTLWVGSGDGAQYSYMDPTALRTFDEQSMNGKILHVDRDGRGLADHRFCPEEINLTLVCTKLYAKGFRNPFRFQLRPGTTPVVGDVGWNTTEELDFVEPGQSYGWPCYEGIIHTVEYEELPECKALYAAAPSQTPPAHNYQHVFGGSGAIVAGPQSTAAGYPEAYRNAWFFGDYGAGWIKAYDLVGGQPANVRDFAPTGFSGVDLETTPEGELVYVNFGDGSTNSGSVRRIVFGNAAPSAAAHATPASGSSPLSVELSADVSVDPDGDSVSYAWDFESDGSDDAHTRTASHVYTTPGVYDARLTVTDERGAVSHDTVTIAVDDAPPVATIAAPVDGSLFRHGSPVLLRGSANDAVDGELTGDSLRWRIVLHHGHHIHLVASQLPGADRSFTPPGDHDADSYYEIEFTATDSAGLHDTRTIVIRPETIALTLASSPPGATLSYSARKYVAPVTLTTAIGYRTSVSAPETLTVGATSYRFEGWSDGGARSHQFVIPAEDRTLTAGYRAAAVPPGSAAAVLDSQQTGPALVAPRPRLRLDRPGRRTRTLAGRVSGVAARPRVLVGLRTVRSGGRCRRWSADHGRLAGLSRACASGHTWMRATVTKMGASAWRWKVRLRGVPRAGRYVVATRVTDGRGRTLIRSTSASLRLR
jgi:glucose/arabinose dehydrogenase